jgi:hypothetical protein
MVGRECRTDCIFDRISYELTEELYPLLLSHAEIPAGIGCTERMPIMDTFPMVFFLCSYGRASFFPLQRILFFWKEHHLINERPASGI